MNASFLCGPVSTVVLCFSSVSFPSLFCPVDDPAFMDHIPQPLDMGIKGTYHFP